MNMSSLCKKALQHKIIIHRYIVRKLYYFTHVYDLFKNVKCYVTFGGDVAIQRRRRLRLLIISIGHIQSIENGALSTPLPFIGT